MKRLSAATAFAAGIAGVIVAAPTTAVSAAAPAPAAATADLAAGWGDQLEAAEAATLEGDGGALARLASPTLRGGAAATLTPASLDLLLAKARDRAELIRNSIVREGFEIRDAEVSTSTAVTKRTGKVKVRVTVTRTWKEIDPGTQEVTDVGDSDVYVVEAPSVNAAKPLTSSAALGVEVASVADSTEKLSDPVVRGAETSVARPKVARVEDGATPSTLQQSTMAAAAAEPPLDHVKFAEYGKKWTASPYNGDDKADFNPDYPYFGNNCANFVSQMFNKAGWKRTGGVNPNDDDNWDDNLTGPYGATDTWAGAADLYRYAYNKKNLAALGNIWNAVPGNTYFMDWDGNSKINHVAAVTGRTDAGIPRISQKTGNRNNMLLTTWKEKVDKDNPNVKWFGLRRTTK